MTDALRGPARERAGRSASPTAAATGSRPVRTAETGGPSGYGAGRKARGRKRHATVDVEGFPIAVQVHAAGAQDRDGAPDVILAMLEKAPEVRKLRADGGRSGPKLEAALTERGLGPVLETVRKPKETEGFAVLCRRWVAERTFAWMPGRWRLAKDVERTLESSLAWVRPAACRFLMRRVARETTP